MPNCDRSLERKVVYGTLPEFKWKAVQKRALNGESFDDLSIEYGFPPDILRQGIVNRMGDALSPGSEWAKYFIYLVTSDEFRESGLYKIGMTGGIEKRLVAMQTGCPYRLYALRSYAVCSPVIIEKALHSAFDEKRRVGEWFDLSPDDIQKIDTAMNADGISESKNPFEIVSSLSVVGLSAYIG